MLTDTRWGGRPVTPGSSLIVDQATARRWVGRGIAAVEEIIPENSKLGPGSVTLRRVATSSWYDIVRGDEVLDRVQGKANAEARAKELESE